MTDKHSQKDGPMNSETVSKLRAATEALAHNKAAVMAAAGNPYDGVPTEELRILMAVVCPLAQAAMNECDALSQEIQRREPPE